MNRNGDVIVFYGALRSGSTLLRLMLDAHPDITCPGERDFMLDALRSTPDGGLVLEPDALESSWIFRDAELPVPQARDGQAAFEELVAADRATQPAKVHVLVMHRRLDRMLQVMPQARFIHLLRDPRDVARSSIGMGWAGNTLYGIEHWLETERDWVKQTRDLPEDRIFTLRYEDLLEQPEAELQRLCDFIGLPYSARMLEYASDSTYEPVDPKLAYQWRRKQTPAEVSDTEWKAAELMARYGYDPSPGGPRAPNALRRLRLALQNRVEIWRRRIRRYGLKDPFIVGWSRRVGPKHLGEAAQRRIDAKTLEYLK